MTIEGDLHIEGPAYHARAEIYDCFFGDRSFEIAGWGRLAERYGPRIVEWMCGTGELACGLAQAGFDVIGVDLVPEMLAVATQRGGALTPKWRPCWVQGDMCNMILPRCDNDFGFIPAGSFGHLLTLAEQICGLRNVLRHLRSGGALAMTLSFAGSESFRDRVRGPFAGSRSAPSGATARKVFVRERYDAATRVRTIHDRVEIVLEGSRRILEYSFPIRHFTPEEIRNLLTEAGFMNVEMFGDYDLSPWRPGAPEWIVCAGRP